MPSNQIANSSPPSRATMSPGRLAVRSRAAVARNARSPASWPQRSFSVLKLSRSMNISVPGSLSRSSRSMRRTMSLGERAAVVDAGQRIGAGLAGHFLLDRAMFQHDADGADAGTEQRQVIGVERTLGRVAPDDEAGTTVEPGRASRRPGRHGRPGPHIASGPLTPSRSAPIASSRTDATSPPTSCSRPGGGALSPRVRSRRAIRIEQRLLRGFAAFHDQRAIGAQRADQRLQRPLHHAGCEDFGVHVPDDVVDQLRPAQRAGHRRVGAVVFGDVAPHAAGADMGAVTVEQGRHRDAHPAQFAIRALQPDPPVAQG